MQKNDVVCGVVDGIGYNGEGIIHSSGTTCFVPFSLVGEKILFKVLKVDKNIAYGKIEAILEPSSSRVKPNCTVFTKCGGCQLQHCEYFEQLKIKSKIVVDCFKKIAALDITVNQAVKSDKIYGYRNKLQLPIRADKKGFKIGFFRENSHDIVSITSCPLHESWASQIIEVFTDFITENNISCYNEITKKGLLRHVVVRTSNNDFLITVVINGDKLLFVNRLIEALKQKFEIFSLYVNINKATNNVILGKTFQLICGKGYLDINEQDVSFKIGAESFFQVNDDVRKKLYDEVIKLAAPEKGSVVIDGYSGVGILTAMLAKKADKAYGIEIIKEAALAGERLANKNGLTGKMESIAAPCEVALPELIEKLKNYKKRILVLDPPRKGVDKNIIESILKAKPDLIVYVSCSPQTLARDAGLIVGSLKYENGAIDRQNGDFIKNYTIKTVKTFDLFPQTKHIETVACFEKV